MNDDLRHRASCAVSSVGNGPAANLTQVEDIHGEAVTHVLFDSVSLVGSPIVASVRPFLAAWNGGLTHETQIDNVTILPEPGFGLGLALLGRMGASSSRPPR